jgi:RHS repeat-associated protein
MGEQMSVMLADYRPQPPAPTMLDDKGRDPYVDALVAIEREILQNPDARPAIWGQTSILGGAEYRLNLDDNGVAIGEWTIDWGDGSALQSVGNDPWIIHRFADQSARYKITAIATAAADDGNFLPAHSIGTEPVGTGVSPAQQQNGTGVSPVPLEDTGNMPVPPDTLIPLDAVGLEVTVQNVPPVLRVSGDRTATAGKTFNVPGIGRFTHPNAPDSHTFFYQIDWGDGNVDESSIIAQPSNGPMLSASLDASHVYEDPGAYYASVTVMDAGGASDTQSFRVIVSGGYHTPIGDYERNPAWQTHESDTSTTPSHTDIQIEHADPHLTTINETGELDVQSTQSILSVLNAPAEQQSVSDGPLSEEIDPSRLNHLLVNSGGSIVVPSSQTSISGLLDSIDSNSSADASTLGDQSLPATNQTMEQSPLVSEEVGGVGGGSLSSLTCSEESETEGDPAMLAAVREALALPVDAPVTEGDWARLTELLADSNKVLSLDGIENAINLVSFTLVPGDFSKQGHLTSLAQLDGLEHLTNLTLQGCGLNDDILTDFSDPSLPALETLDLRYNNISTIPSDLADLPKLKGLSVYGNPLTDDPRAGLANLAGKLINVDLAPDHPEKALTHIDPTNPTATYQELAGAFYNLPIEIYEYLVNTIEYRPYQGAMKGPLAVLQSGEGNDWDTDSLLAGLFQQTGISTLYTWGRVVENLQVTMNRLGVKTVAAAYDALYLAGLNPKLTDANLYYLDPITQLASAVCVEFDHVWLQASVTPPGSSGPQTVYLDPSWKLKDLHPGLPGVLDAAPFVTDGSACSYLGSVTDQTAAEYYEELVRDYLADPAHPELNGLTIADVAYDGPIHVQAVSTLPDVFPFICINTQGGPAATIPDALVHRVRISLDVQQSGTVTCAPNGSGTITITAASNVFTSAMMNTPVVLNNTASGQAQAFTIISNITAPTNTVVVQGSAGYTSGFTSGYWLPNFSSLQTVPEICLERITVGYTGSSNLTPHLYLNGSEASYGLSPSALPGGAADVSLVIQMMPGNTGYTCGEYSHVYKRAEGKYMAIGLDAGQLTDQMLLSARKIVNDANINQANDNNWKNQSQVNNDQLTGGLLSLAMIDYFLKSANGDKSVARLTEAMLDYNMVASGVATADTALSDNGGINTNLQIRYLPASMGIDVPTANWNSISIDETAVTCVPFQERTLTPTDIAHYVLMACANSAMEALICEDLTNTPSISTTKSMQMAYEFGTANAAGYKVETFDSSNIGQIDTDLSALSGACGANIRNNIRNFINNNPGYSVRVPTHYTTIDTGSAQWQGVGYFVVEADGVILCNIIDNGLEAPHGAWTGGDANDATPRPSIPEGPTVGDPIEIANGNVIHDETDISIPNLGVPLSFSRHYASNTTVSAGQTPWSNRGLGEGWSFSFGDWLEFDGSDVYWHTSEGLTLEFTYNGLTYSVPDSIFGAFTHDQSNHFYLWRDKSGNTMKFDEEGNLLRMADRYDNGVAISYDANGHIATVNDLFDATRQLYFTYNASNRIASIGDFTGRLWQYEYNAAGRLVQVTAPIDPSAPLAAMRYSYYDDDGNPNTPDGPALAGLLKSVTDPNGNSTQYAYYVNRRGFQVTDAEGNTHGVSHDIYRNRTDFIDERGLTTSYIYDVEGRETQQIRPDRTTVSYTWSGGLKTSVTDAFGQTESYDYYNDGKGNLWHLTDRLGHITTFSYSSQYSNLLSIYRENTDHALTTYTYSNDGIHGNDDGKSLWKAAEDASGLNCITTYQYNWSSNRGLVSAMTTPNGQGLAYGYTTWYVYNAAGQATALYSPVVTTSGTPPTHASHAGYIENTFTYDARGFLQSSTDGEDNETTYTYDVLGHCLKTTSPDPDGNDFLPAPVTTFIYDAAGNKILTALTTSGPQQASLTMNDKMDRPLKTVHADGTHRTKQYDLAGNVTCETDESGRITQYLYDSCNRCIAVLRPDGSSVRTIYNGGGLVVGMIDANGNLTKFEYDALGRKTKEILPDPDGELGPLTESTTLYGYDSQGNLQYTTDAEGEYADDPNHSTDYTYDKIGRKLTETLADPDGDGSLSRPTTYYHYNANGNLLSKTDARASMDQDPAHTTSYLHDEMGRKIVEELPDPDCSGPLGNLYTWHYYDANGNLQYEVNPLGAGANRPVEFSSSPDYTTEYVYDQLGRKIQEILPDPDSGSGPQTRPTTTYAFDAGGNLASKSDPLGNVTRYVYDLRNRMTQVTDALGAYAGDPAYTTSTCYDAAGNAVLVIDALGRITVYQYDALNRKISQTTPLPMGASQGEIGPRTIWQYDPNGNVIQETDPLGHRSYTRYNAWNLPVATTDALGSGAGDPLHTMVTAYDQLGRIVSVMDQLYRTTQFIYDNLGRRIEQIDPDPDDFSAAGGSDGPLVSAHEFYGYDANGNLKYTTGPRSLEPGGSGRGDPNFTSWFFYDTLNRKVCEIDPLGEDFNVNAIPDTIDLSQQHRHGVVTAYDKLGNVVSITEAVDNGVYRTTDYHYDNLGRKLEEVAPPPDPLQPTVRPTNTFSYDAAGNLLSSADPLGHTTWCVYDALGRQIRSVDALGSGPGDSHHATFTVYDALGNVLSVTDPEGNTTSYSYDRLNRLMKDTDPLWNDRLYEYDAAGNLTAKMGRNGLVTEYTYDLANRRIWEDWFDSTVTVCHTIHTEYDAAGQVRGIIESDLDAAAGSRCLYVYDQAGRVVRQRAAPGDLTQLPPDALIDTLGNSQYTSGFRDWDNDGVAEPYVQFTVYLNVYSVFWLDLWSCSNPHFTPALAVVRPNGNQEEAWAIDGHDEIPFEITADEAGTWEIYVTSPDADAFGSYMLQWQLNHAVPAAMTEIAYSYYTDGGLQLMNDSLNGGIYYQYDALGRTTLEAQGAWTGQTLYFNKQVTFTYFDDGSPKTITRYLGDGVTEVAATNYQIHDGMGRLTALEHAFGSSQIDYTWQYDAASNVAQMTSSTDGEQNYTLDDTNQLTNVTDDSQQTLENYSYDSNGNRTGAGCATGAANRLLCEGTFNYEYDAEGNRTLRTRISSAAADDHFTDYYWDNRNRLTGVAFRNNSGNFTKVVWYGYDSAGRQATRYVSSASGAMYYYTACQEDGQSEGSRPLLDIRDQDGLGGDTYPAYMNRRYLNGPAVDQVLATEAGNNWLRWGLADHEGTIRDVIEYLAHDVYGSWHVPFDSFGKPLDPNAMCADYLFGLSGMPYDPATGMYQTDTRPYDPLTGRFPSEDWTRPTPDANTYRWCGNNPMTQTDPSGRCPKQDYDRSAWSSLLSNIITFFNPLPVPSVESLVHMEMPEEWIAALQPENKSNAFAEFGKGFAEEAFNAAKSVSIGCVASGLVTPSEEGWHALLCEFNPLGTNNLISSQDFERQLQGLAPRSYGQRFTEDAIVPLNAMMEGMNSPRGQGQLAFWGTPYVAGQVISNAGRIAERIQALRGVSQAEAEALPEICLVELRYGGEAQRQALLNRVSETKSLSEAKGLVYAFREMKKLDYRLVNASLHYSGNQGLDLVFFKNGRYAIVESKCTGSIGNLKQLGQFRQGSYKYNVNRLERYLLKGNGDYNPLVNNLLEDAGTDNLASYATFYKSRKIYELPKDWPKVKEILRNP